jgi:hypothetical protein
MKKRKFPEGWKALYAAAMLESDNTQLRHRIEIAATAMQTRLKELPETLSTRSEQTELQSALNYLHRWDEMLTGDLKGSVSSIR